MEPSERQGYGGSTQRLISLRREMESHGYPNLMEWLDEWRILRTKPLREQRGFVMGHISVVREDPTQKESLLLLGLVFVPQRRKIGRMLRGILDVDEGSRRNRAVVSPQEAAALKEMDIDRFNTATRRATFEAIYRYPATEPEAHRFLAWSLEVIAMRAVAALRAEVATYKSTSMTATLIETMRAVALEAADARSAELPLGEAEGLDAWLERIDIETLYAEDIEPLHGHAQKQRICDDAVGRLAPRQADVITGTFYEDATVAQIASRNVITRQTVYSTREQARRRLRKDPTFYDELCAIHAICRASNAAPAEADALNRKAA